MENPLSKLRGAAKRSIAGTPLSAQVVAAHFDDFLSAPIGEERNGQVSVISMFGRLGIDPWQEAFDLAELSKPAAIRRLASSIDALALPMEPTTESGAIAAVVIARLPRRIAAPAATGVLAAGVERAKAVKPWVAILVAGIVLLLVQPLFSENSHAPVAAAPQSVGNGKP